MKYKVIILALLLISFTSTLGLLFYSRAKAKEGSGKTVSASPETIWVPDNYTKIQWAVGNASSGDIVRVRAGTYYEHLTVDKSVSLVGENRSTTIIDGNGTGTVVHVVANNVCICGFTIRKSGPWPEGGIVGSFSDNNTICGNIVANNNEGIYLEESIGNNVSNNVITNNSDGIRLFHCNVNTFIENTITKNRIYGLFLEDCDNNDIYRNLIASNGFVGLDLRGSFNRLRDNNLTGNLYNFGASGNINDIDASNIVDGKPIYYWVNQHDKQIPTDAGYVAIIDSVNITVRNLTLENNYQGILFKNTDNSTIENVNILNNEFGVLLTSSESNIIKNNTISSTGWIGFRLYESKNNKMRDNNLTGNHYAFTVEGRFLPHFIQDIDASNKVNGKPIYYITNQKGLIIDPFTFPDVGYLALVNSTNIIVKDLSLTSNPKGILLAYITNCTITNLTFSYNIVGVKLLFSGGNFIKGNTIARNLNCGVSLEHSNNNTISDNTISKSFFYASFTGISLKYSNNNTVSGNTISKCDEGIRIIIGYNNSIYHNNFMDNIMQVYLHGSYDNIWDNSVEGNYWSDYNGTDADQDGIGDIAYIIDGNNNDYHTLMGVFYDFPVTWGEETYHVQVISNSTVSNLYAAIWLSSPTEYLSPGDTFIHFNVSCEEGTGFCRVAIPRALLNDSYVVLVDGNEVHVEELPISNGMHAFLYFTYLHDTHEVIIAPEFPSALILLLLLIIALIAVIAAKRTLISGVMKK